MRGFAAVHDHRRDGENRYRDCANVYRGTLPVWDVDHLGAIVSGVDAPRQDDDYADWGDFRDYMHQLSVKAELLSMGGAPRLVWHPEKRVI